MATATRIRFDITTPFVQECEKKSIRRVDCGRLTHIDCVGFCERVLDDRGIDFVCRTCAYCDEDEYDWEKSLSETATVFTGPSH